MKKNIIVYGLGKEYKKQESIIKEEYNIIAVSDKKRLSETSPDFALFIAPEMLNELEYDYIYITTNKYLSEITKELVEKYKVPATKIISPQNVWWFVPNSEARDIWVKNKISDIKAGSKILDAGAGTCKYKKYCDKLKYTSQDFGQFDDVVSYERNTAYKEWESKKCDILCDITAIPVEDESFDVILCTEVLEHLSEPRLAIKEFHRILRTGGQLLLTAPFCSLTHMAPYYYVNGFSPYWYHDALESNGFKINELAPNGNYFKYIAQELIRVPEMAERFGIKLKCEDKEALNNMLKCIVNQANNDKGSDEILCFGYFVDALKVK